MTPKEIERILEYNKLYNKNVSVEPINCYGEEQVENKHMTMPHLMNCSHSPDGWCLDCVRELQSKIDKQDEVFNLLVQHAESTEWMTRHAAENSYCPYCSTEEDQWEDQHEHHENCKYTEMMKKAKEIYIKSKIDCLTKELKKIEERLKKITDE